MAIEEIGTTATEEVKHYVVDSVADLLGVNTGLAAGTDALVPSIGRMFLTPSGKWSAEEGYSVTIVMNNKKVALNAARVGNAVQAPSLTYPDGYTLDEYNTADDKSGDTITFPYTPTADITVYAVLKTTP